MPSGMFQELYTADALSRALLQTSEDSQTKLIEQFVIQSCLPCQQAQNDCKNTAPHSSLTQIVPNLWISAEMAGQITNIKCLRMCARIGQYEES